MVNTSRPNKSTENTVSTERRSLDEVLNRSYAAGLPSLPDTSLEDGRCSTSLQVESLVTGRSRQEKIPAHSKFLYAVNILFRFASFWFALKGYSSSPLLINSCHILMRQRRCPSTLFRLLWLVRTTVSFCICCAFYVSCLYDNHVTRRKAVINA